MCNVCDRISKSGKLWKDFTRFEKMLFVNVNPRLTLQHFLEIVDRSKIEGNPPLRCRWYWEVERMGLLTGSYLTFILGQVYLRCRFYLVF